MGTNYYFMRRNKELMQTFFAEKSEYHFCKDALSHASLFAHLRLILYGRT